MCHLVNNNTFTYLHIACINVIGTSRVVGRVELNSGVLYNLQNLITIIILNVQLIELHHHRHLLLLQPLQPLLTGLLCGPGIHVNSGTNSSL